MAGAAYNRMIAAYSRRAQPLTRPLREREQLVTAKRAPGRTALSGATCRTMATSARLHLRA
eukprot:5257571-Pleurochrysis_carterae.AAC.1